MRTPAARLTVDSSRSTPGVPTTSRTKLSFAIATALSGAASLQSAPVLAADASADANTLEEVVVTARKRTENLQDVPISIDVYTSKDLQELGDLTVRGLRQRHAVPFLCERRTGHADHRVSRRLGWQQPQLLEHGRDALLARRHVDELLRDTRTFICMTSSASKC